MKKIKVKIKVLRQGGATEELVAAYVMKEVPGLAIHEDYFVPGRWTVTHITSGYCLPDVAFFNTRAEATAFVLDMQKVPWEKTREEMITWLRKQENEELRKRVLLG